MTYDNWKSGFGNFDDDVTCAKCGDVFDVNEPGTIQYDGNIHLCKACTGLEREVLFFRVAEGQLKFSQEQIDFIKAYYNLFLEAL